MASTPQIQTPKAPAGTTEAAAGFVAEVLDQLQTHALAGMAPSTEVLELLRALEAAKDAARAIKIREGRARLRRALEGEVTQFFPVS
jgi:hypothetical protein